MVQICVPNILSSTTTVIMRRWHPPGRDGTHRRDGTGVPKKHKGKDVQIAVFAHPHRRDRTGVPSLLYKKKFEAHRSGPVGMYRYSADYRNSHFFHSLRRYATADEKSPEHHSSHTYFTNAWQVKSFLR